MPDMAMPKKNTVHKQRATLTPKTDTKPVEAVVDDSARLKEIRGLVKDNNLSQVDDNVIICQIYMESRFDPNPHTDGSSARGLMQLLKAPIREFSRIENLKRPHSQQQKDAAVFAEADKFHDSPQLLDQATNIQTGTKYLQLLIDRETKKGAVDPIAEAYKDYRGLRNGVYYNKIMAASEKLAQSPDSMAVLRDMVK
jgi:soluble lytic murein transglycosylase-like protein